MVLFLCRNKSSWNGTKLWRIFYINNKNFWSQDPPERGPRLGTTTRARPPLQARPGGLYPLGGPADDPPDTINSHYSRKNQGERIIAIHETEPPPSPVLPREGISKDHLGLRRGGGSSIFVITNTSPLPIPWCSPPRVSNNFVGLLVGEELDEIHHVIELVLLGPDP